MAVRYEIPNSKLIAYEYGHLYEKNKNNARAYLTLKLSSAIYIALGSARIGHFASGREQQYL